MPPDTAAGSPGPFDRKTPSGSSARTSSALVVAGSDEQQREWLTPCVESFRLVSFCLSEPGAGSDVAGLRTTARKVGDDYVINGSKTYITNGTRADFVTLMVKTDADAGHGEVHHGGVRHHRSFALGEEHLVASAFVGERGASDGQRDLMPLDLLGDWFK